MTNHDEAAGRSGDEDICGLGGLGGHDGHDMCGGGGERHGQRRPGGRSGDEGHELPGGHSGQGEYTACAGHGVTRTPGTPGGPGVPGGEHQVTLRTPAELADALPYLLGYRPEDSIVLVALHDRERRGRFGGRARLGIPAHAEDWPSVAEQLAQGLVKGSERRGSRPESMVAYLCQEPGSGESGREVMERLRPLAQLLRTACGRLDVPVIEALCISDGRFWSYTCPGQGCCPPEGESMGLPGTSVLAAAATYAGLQVRGSLRELTARLLPWESAAAQEQEVALDMASMALVPRILDGESRAEVAEEALELARRIIGRLADAPPVSGTRPADLRDDGLLEHEEAATLILGLQDRTTRDRAAEWMEGDEAVPALRLWRALSRRCVGPYREHAAAPLTLAGWVAWSTGDELEAREALAMALGADPDYLFARLLHQACNEGLDPESIRRCLRAERTGRAPEAEEPAGPTAPLTSAEPTPGPRLPGVATRRRRRPRPAGNGGVRPSRRGPGTPSDRRRRPADEVSPAGDGPGRAAEGTSGRPRARRDGDRQGAGEDA
ncbi:MULTISPECIES: DUF4192 family protein [unclassified Streptomyces]|uniref:DUF4192 domain-containing protein n=1 Tax=unclassified Streptomyces TaxID=2593676 RepID=UPI002E820060|nr:DUF4192 family protein [Streptomyces sp. NBC_00589]WTI35773.1 DUF4192 family protein [Streptomyces sp. NBC_00775]WUB30553.1 DUF4192 family protein [Streptomyces sp. NBC_00589]